MQENARAIRCPIQFRSEEQEFIRDEVKKLAEAGVIEKSQPPWRAQVVDLKTDNLEKQICLECSTTGNRFTDPDAYPIPVIEHFLFEQARGNSYTKT